MLSILRLIASKKKSLVASMFAWLINRKKGNNIFLGIILGG